MPDVLALNPTKRAAFIIEAKSGTTDRLVVPAHQIEQCIEWYRTLAPFSNRHVVLAFKFLSKKRIGLGKYNGRQLREFYKEWDTSMRPIEFVCLYNGTTYGRDAKKRVKLSLADCRIPIRGKHTSKRKDI